MQTETTTHNETTSKRPAYRLVRFYGESKNAPRGEIGAIWETDKGLSIIINGLEGQIRLMAFPVEQQPV